MKDQRSFDTSIFQPIISQSVIHLSCPTPLHSDNQRVSGPKEMSSLERSKMKDNLPWRGQVGETPARIPAIEVF